MKTKISFLLLICLSVTSFANSQPYFTENQPTLFATCSSIMDGMEVQLDFFKVSSKKGYWAQLISDQPFALAELKISDTNNVRTLEMSVPDAPEVSFAKFDIPTDKKSFKVEIFALQVGRTWGTFDCKAE